MSDLVKQENKEMITNLVLKGDLSGMSQAMQIQYYNNFCDSLNLNPLTQPFHLLKMNGKIVMYANKNCGEQLRKNNSVSVIEMDQKIMNDICIITVKVQDKTGRVDTEIGAVSVKNLGGENLANAMMKACTKAKRRATLSICSVGLMDETEVEAIPEAKKVPLPVVVTNVNHQPVAKEKLIKEMNDISVKLGFTNEDKAPYKAMVEKGEVKNAHTLLVGLAANQEKAQKAKL